MPTWPARTRAATPASSTARRRARGRIATVTERTPAVTATRVSRRRSTSETRRSGSSIATPHVMAWVAGHSHENKITPLRRTGGGYWEIKSPAVADWSTHHRLLDPPPPARLDGQPRRDLLLFGTLLDFAAPISHPRSGNASAFGARTLASIARTLTYNDPQQGPDGSEGTRADRNVELLLRDPRRGDGVNGTNGNDVIRGTSGNDVIN